MTDNFRHAQYRDDGTQIDDPQKLSELSQSQIGSLATFVLDVESPTDSLTPPLQQVHLNAAMSSTAVLTAVATGTFNKARVVWNNNGASASAKLRIAVNPDNDLHGLLITQSALRRDHEMTMGDGVILVCADPITNLAFSADGAINAGLHSLLITFGD